MRSSQALSTGRPLQRLLDELLRLLDRLRRNIGERQAAERPGQAVPRARAVHIDEFERAAAKVADHAVGAVHAGNHAERSELGLARAGQHVDVGADGAFGELDESGTVFGVAAGGRGDGESFLHAHRLAQRAEAPQRRERVLDRVRGEEPRRLHFAAEPAQRLLVEQLGRAAREALIDDKAHGIRADVDDGNRRTVVQASLGVEFGAAHGSVQRKALAACFRPMAADYPAHRLSRQRRAAGPAWQPAAPYAIRSFTCAPGDGATGEWNPWATCRGRTDWDWS